jgi:hypothetical protein
LKLNSAEKELTRKISEIQQLARKLKLDIKKKDEEKVKAEVKDLEKPIEDEDVDILYTELAQEDLITKDRLLPTGEKGVTLFDTPARGISLSPLLLERIGESVKNIVSNENQNWALVIHDLNESRAGFSNLAPSEVSEFLQQIPLGQLQLENINEIKEMLANADITYNESIYDFLMKHLAENNEPVQVQALFDEIVSKGITANKYMFGHLIKAYTKSKNIDRINLTLNKMYSEGLEPSVKVYTNVLKLCVDLSDFKQADEIFQMMKFRSAESKPDIEAYNTMIELADRRKDIYRANDLYLELLNEGLKPTVFTYNCLAKICSKSEKDLLKGWQYIIEINEQRLEPNVYTFSVMLRLAAKDGDLELARAMYLKIFEMQSNTTQYAMNESAVLLFMAYRDFKFDRTPQLLHFKEGALIRRNTIALVDFLGLHQNIVDDPLLSKQRENYPPFLPVRTLTNSQQVIAESNAVWVHYLLNNPHNIVTANIVTYLKIAVEHGDKAEFIRRYETFTYPSSEINKNKVIIDTEIELESADVKPEEATNPPALQFIANTNLKMERNSEIYTALLIAGRRFKDIELCEKAWLERGEYRKTIKYQKLPESVRTKLDHKFSYEMVLALLQLNLVYDAVHVVKSSQKQFKWDFYALKPLYQRLIELGDDTSAKDISMICNRALLK